MTRDETTVFQRDYEPLSRSSERFAPGTIIAGRYRIIALLGRGGMGEVYRADDVRLDQQVALKFLPLILESDREMLDRFLSEVRLGRQVSHPNVCRLYDVGDHEGHHFITMEYVDGEDLCSLLQRIGKLPAEKAIDIARGIAAGLAVAHALGIVHRDLKPSNVMIDGKGRARITDFGLASLGSESASDGMVIGTPAYMAPEQLTGGGATARSDVYALGVILYECLTGQSMFAGDSNADVIRRRTQEAEPAPLSGLPDIDPTIDHLLRRCLHPDPAMRPANAHEVLAWLPGGDPLAAALAAGETPSPELVAAAAGRGSLSVRMAWMCLAFVIVAVIATTIFSGRTKLYRRIDIRAPEGLADRAMEIASAMSAPAPQDRSWWTSFHPKQVAWLSANSDGSNWDRDVNAWPSPYRFTYRQSPRPMIGFGWDTRIAENQPPLDVPGMTRVTLDQRGRLLELARVPVRAPGKAASMDDWTRLFALAELPMERFTAGAPVLTPPVLSDEHRAWTGTIGEGTRPLRVEAASYKGEPVWFAVNGPWNIDRPVSAIEVISRAVGATLRLFVPLLCGVLAFFNFRRGRTDRRVAWRLALIAFVSTLIAYLFRAHHVTSVEEVDLLSRIIGGSLFVAATVALGYLGLEPYVRRYQPGALISWVRLANGRFRDSLVGRDVLIGVAGGMAANFIWHLHLLAQPLFGFRVAMPQAMVPSMLGGANVAVSVMIYSISSSLLDGISVAVLLVVWRALVKQTWLATLLLHLCVTLICFRMFGDVAEMRIANAAIVAALVLVVFRYAGVLGVAVLAFSSNVYGIFPTTLDVHAYYFGRGLVAMLMPIAIAIFGFVVALGGRSAFGEATTAREPVPV